jgi:hypothetical protein
MSKYKNQKTLVPHIRLTSFSFRTLIGVCIALIAGLTISARAWLTPAITTKPVAPKLKTESAAPGSTQSTSAQEHIDAEVITLRPNGFEPAEITRPTGRFLLLLENYSGIKDIKLQIAVNRGAKLHEIKFKERNLVGGQELDLHPGQYVLTEADHPKWICRITITN